MSADRLREAAALMRSRAKVGGDSEFPSPWIASLDDHYHDTYEVLCHEDGSGLVTDGLGRDVAEHIAAWHPVVALAVADWLEATARELDALGDPDLSNHPQDGRRTAALAVAVAYLGSPA